MIRRLHWWVCDHQKACGPSSGGGFQCAATRSFLARLGKSNPLAPQLPTAVSHIVQRHAVPALLPWTEGRTLPSMEKVLLDGTGSQSVHPAFPKLNSEQQAGCFHDPRIHHACVSVFLDSWGWADCT